MLLTEENVFVLCVRPSLPIHINRVHVLYALNVLQIQFNCHKLHRTVVHGVQCVFHVQLSVVLVARVVSPCRAKIKMDVTLVMPAKPMPVR